MIRILRIPFSTNVERVALAFGHKGIDVEWVDVDAADRTPVRALSGQDLVPVLDADGEIVVDSTLIIAWLEERVPDPPLFPPEPARRAELEVFLDWFNRVWKVPPNAIEAELGRDEPDRVRIDTLATELGGSRDVFEALLDGRDYLFGAFSAADCIAFPFLKYALFGLPEGDDERFHRILVDHLELGSRYPRLADWIRRVDAHPRSSSAATP